MRGGCDAPITNLGDNEAAVLGALTTFLFTRGYLGST